MPPKTTEPAVAELERLEQRLAECRQQRQEVHADAEQLHVERDRLRAARVQAYASEDEAEAEALSEAIAALNVQTEAAVAKLAGADQRVVEAEAAALGVYEARGMELLHAQVERDREVAEQLAAAVHEALELNRRLVAGRQQQDAILARTPGRSPRADGPPASHALERELRDLDHAARQLDGSPLVVPRCMAEHPAVVFPGE